MCKSAALAVCSLTGLPCSPHGDYHTDHLQPFFYSRSAAVLTWQYNRHNNHNIKTCPSRMLGDLLGAKTFANVVSPCVLRQHTQS